MNFRQLFRFFEMLFCSCSDIWVTVALTCGDTYVNK